MRRNPRQTVAIGLVLFLGRVHSALAGDFQWTGACGIDWSACCALGDNNINNWNVPATPQQACLPLPGPDSNVNLGDGAFVEFNTIGPLGAPLGPQTIASLHSDGSPFRKESPNLTVTNNDHLCGPFERNSGVFTVGPVMTVDKVWRWFGGKLAGPGTTTASVAILFGSLGNSISERTVISTGNASWSDSGNTEFFFGGVFENQNIF